MGKVMLSEGHAQTSIYERINAGLPLDILVIDAHAHLLPQTTPATAFLWTRPEEMLVSMDRLGIDIACISAVGSGEQNDEVIETVRRLPDRFVGFILVNPRYPDRMIPELERCFAAHPGIRGIGEIHPPSYTHHYPVTGSNYRVLWEYAAYRRVPVLIHSGPASEAAYCSPAQIARVAEWHPSVPFLIGHCGAYDSWNMLEEAIEVTRRHDNLFLEICAMGRHYGIVEYLVQKVGADRVLFGTDAPFHDWTAEVAHVAYAKISDEAKEKIFGLNMKVLLGI
jgi:predicted TIM-barrel fold metal-dependent hydrolase